MPGADLNLDLPTPGTTSWPEWATKVNAAFNAIVNDLEPLVRSDEFSIVGNVACNGYSVTDAKEYACRSGNTVAIGTNAIGVLDGDWYATDSSGRSVRLTQDGAIALSATGGFTGDYVSSGATARYTNATQLYEFLDSSGAYADIKADNVVIAASASNEVTVTYSGAVDYTLTLPTALPAATALLSMDSSGNLSTSATIGTAVTINNANVTLSGTADLKHPDRTECFSSALCKSDSAGASSWSVTSNSPFFQTTSAAATVDGYFAPPCNLVGNRIKSVAVRASNVDGGTFTLNVYKATSTALGASIASASSAIAATVTLTATPGSPPTLVAGEIIVVRVQYSGGLGSTQTVYDIRVTYDRP